MKCIYCGAELKEGCIYCSKCGKEVQLVPDYSGIEDDYLKALITSNEAPDDTAKKNISNKPPVKPKKQETEPEKKKNDKSNDKKDKKDQKKKLMIVICAVVAIVIAIISIIILLQFQLKERQNNSVDYQLQKAKEAEKSGYYNEAEKYYKKALNLDSKDADILMALGDLYLTQKEYDSAIAEYKEVLKLDKTNKTAYRNLISIYDKQKDYDSIIALSKTVTDSKLLDLFSDYLVTAPVFNQTAGTYDEFIDIKLSGQNSCEIYYTKDGKDPIKYGERYTDPIQLDEMGEYEIKAVCVNDKDIYSDVVSNKYKIDIPAPDMPVVTPDGGNFGAETTVTVSVSDGCKAYYTWDGSDPDENSQEYTDPIPVPDGNNVLSVVLIDESTGLSSPIYRGNFVYFH